MNTKLSFLFCILLFASYLSAQTVTRKEVRLSGNAYVTSHHDGARIGRNGIEKWTDPKSEIKAFVYFSKPQTIRVTVNGLLAEGKSQIKVGIGSQGVKLSQTRKIKLNAGEFNMELKPFHIVGPGYTAITLQGVSKTGDNFGEIRSLTIASEDDKMVFVDDFADYWGRRGPSVHLSYTMPEDTIEWFYNEITVPLHNDVIGSYYMANGFGEGYFGMQCNSENERRVLFSVWSPFETQDPKQIPDSMKIVMLKKGNDVYTGEFGNEGSGGQSFLRYPWKVGYSYRFLTRITPDDKGNTIYTSWFFAPEEDQWRLIASFLRPKTNTYYKRAHSFLENFSPEQGYLTRMVFFGNQWFLTKSGKWISGTEASFTYDATAKTGVRIDYQGGYDSHSNRFYLKNCGFFHDSTEFHSRFQKTAGNQPPEIDFERLP
ncbi:DUF3472 domain-containing protein [Proteiniphilum sp.]|uniref:DUF3472 domain-containing protein n=1 Tax=Proteiniphilum sp. TaxID=1926877 RepID=UPI002B207653|nr:DUF3472 domain-containing protein [Proteiniphilum sp.]MEA4918393.1 DUF3472 domain-containing protein [Proteiniphilum sp.]